MNDFINKEQVAVKMIYKKRSAWSQAKVEVEVLELLRSHDVNSDHYVGEHCVLDFICTVCFFIKILNCNLLRYFVETIVVKYNII